MMIPTTNQDVLEYLRIEIRSRYLRIQRLVETRPDIRRRWKLSGKYPLIITLGSDIEYTVRKQSDGSILKDTVKVARLCKAIDGLTSGIACKASFQQLDKIEVNLFPGEPEAFLHNFHRARSCVRQAAADNGYTISDGRGHLHPTITQNGRSVFIEGEEKLLSPLCTRFAALSVCGQISAPALWMRPALAEKTGGEYQAQHFKIDSSNKKGSICVFGSGAYDGTHPKFEFRVVPWPPELQVLLVLERFESALLSTGLRRDLRLPYGGTIKYEYPKYELQISFAENAAISLGKSGYERHLNTTMQSGYLRKNFSPELRQLLTRMMLKSHLRYLDNIPKRRPNRYQAHELLILRRSVRRSLRRIDEGRSTSHRILREQGNQLML